MRRNQLFWGLVILFLGFYLLIGNIFPQFDLGRFFWPLLLILLGVWFLFGRSFYRRGDVKTETITIPRENATSAEIRFRHGAGKLTVGTMSDPNLLVAGTVNGEVRVETQRTGEIAYIRLNGEPTFMVPMVYPTDGYFWNIGLNGSLPMRVEVETGASDNVLDLTNLKVTDFTLKTGASSTQIMLPVNAGFTRVKVESGAAAVTMRVPEGVAAHIRVQSGLAGININQGRFPNIGGAYETTGYATAVNKVEIFVETGVGSVDVL